MSPCHPAVLVPTQGTLRTASAPSNLTMAAGLVPTMPCLYSHHLTQHHGGHRGNAGSRGTAVPTRVTTTSLWSHTLPAASFRPVPSCAMGLHHGHRAGCGCCGWEEQGPPWQPQLCPRGCWYQLSPMDGWPGRGPPRVMPGEGPGTQPGLNPLPPPCCRTSLTPAALL